MQQGRLTSRPGVGQRILPVALIGIGLVFLLGEWLPGLSRGGLVLVGLGLLFLIGRLTHGRYGYAVPAGLLIGVGAFVTLEEAFPGVVGGPQAGGWLLILLGLGFVLTYLIGLRPAAVWPLLPSLALIGLGLLFFGWTAVLPLASLAWMANAWPLVLVLIGSWLLLRDRVPTPIRRPLAAIGPLLLLGYALVAAAAAVTSGGALARGGFTPGLSPATFAESQALDAPIATDATLTIDNPAGRTTVRAQAQSGGSGGVHVVATRHFAAGGPAPDVQLIPASGGLSLTARGLGGPRFLPFGPAAWVDYDVEVPATTRLRMQAGSGDVDVDGLSGPVEVETGSGGLKLANLAGAVDARAGSGDLDLTNVTGDLRANTGSGSIRGTSLQHLREATTGSGSIVLTGVFTDSAQVRTGSGSIELHLLPTSSVRVDARSQNGRLDVRDLPLTTAERSASGTLGAGAGTLIVQSGSGSIRLSP